MVGSVSLAALLSAGEIPTESVTWPEKPPAITARDNAAVLADAPSVEIDYSTSVPIKEREASAGEIELLPNQQIVPAQPALSGSPAIIIPADGRPLDISQGDILPFPLPGTSVVVPIAERPISIGAATNVALPADGVVFTPAPEISVTGVQTLLVQFDTQKSVVLAQRQNLISQIQTADTDAERIAIAEAYRAEVTVHAAEQRELARQVRDELKRLREDRTPRE